MKTSSGRQNIESLPNKNCSAAVLKNINCIKFFVRIELKKRSKIIGRRCLNVSVVTIADINAVGCAGGGEAKDPPVDHFHDFLCFDLLVLALKTTRLRIIDNTLRNEFLKTHFHLLKITAENAVNGRRDGWCGAAHVVNVSVL